MNKWREACTLATLRLNEAITCGHHAKRLAERPEIGIDNTLTACLDGAMALAEKKSDRLKRGEFHIAVVGSEKAGKSTFINAWLGCDLLPSDMQRCTFTTTHLHSETDNARQRLVIQPKTVQGMQELLSTLNKMKEGDSETANQAKEDLRSLGQHQATLKAVMQEGPQSISFTHISEIADTLRRYVANPAYAHAVERVDLHTSSLAAADGVMFYDVPGLNSGLTKHVQETRDMLEDSDAIILVKNISKPSFDACEKQILQFAIDSDRSVLIAEKTFLFLSYVDKLSKKEAYSKTLAVIRQECARYGLNEKKSVAGTSAGSLYLSGQLKRLENIDEASLKPKLQLLFDLPPTADNAAYLRACGIELLREKIEEYLSTERIGILKKSCDKIVADIMDAAAQILACARKRFPDDLDKAKRQYDERVNNEFTDWWKESWQRIQSKHADPAQESEDIDKRLEDISRQYGEKIAASLDGIPCLQPEERQQIFLALKAKYGNNPSQMNAHWRRDHIAPAVDDIINGMTFDMTQVLFDALERYMGKLDAELWSCLDVKKKLLEKRRDIKDEETYLLWLGSALSALFLRFARPVAEALVKYPAKAPARDDICKTYDGDLKSISHYYQNEAEPEFENLQRYIKRGVDLFCDADLRKRLGLPDLDAQEQEKWRNYTPDTLEGVEREVETDMLALKEYFLHAIFSSSGIGAFARQELLTLHKTFIDSEERFRSAALAAFKHKDPLLIRHLPEHLQNVQFDGEIVNMIKQLAISLRSRQ